MVASLRPALAFTCALTVLEGAAVLRGAAVALEISPSRTSLSQCGGEELEIALRIHNPTGQEIAGL